MFSHDFRHLLVSQLEATLEGSPVDVCVRTTKVDGKTYFWPDSSSDDYIHHPNALDDMCSYEMAMYYKRVVKSKSAVRASINVSTDLRTKDNDDGDDNLGSDDEIFQSTSTGNTCKFLVTHPGSKFTKLTRLKNWVVAMIYYDGARLCSIFNLQIGKMECDENTSSSPREYSSINVASTFTCDVDIASNDIPACFHSRPAFMTADIQVPNSLNLVDSTTYK
jgi:hypothetical protein